MTIQLERAENRKRFRDPPLLEVCQSVGVCQIVKIVGALRQNPSNAARQMQARVRAHYIPRSRQMLTLSEAPQIAHTQSLHTQPQCDL